MTTQHSEPIARAPDSNAPKPNIPEAPARPLEKVLLKLPFVKKYKQYDLASWRKRDIIARVAQETGAYISWYTGNYLKIRHYGLHRVKKYGRLDLSKLETREILSIAKHEGHRIEKAYYAGYMKTEKFSTYYNSKKTIAKALDVLKERGEFEGRPDTLWLQMIHDSFYQMDELMNHEIKPVPAFDPIKLVEFGKFSRERRSTRRWAQSNLPEDSLYEIAKALIECAKWAPCSGNRQPWYFRILTKDEDKELLRGIKEEHCISAPLIIFLGNNKTSYGAIGNREHGIYVDGGAAAMQMVMAAHNAGLGSCWNHFCKDFVYSRPKNLRIFKQFYRKMNIPDEIEPIALIAFGIPAFVSPPPERAPFESLCPDRE